MAEGMNGYSLSDIGALMGNGGFGGNSWIMLLFFFVLFANGGAWGGNNQYATSNEVQRGFDNQNSVANQRETLAAVTSGTAQAVAATNQAFHDNLNVIQDKYGELTRDIYGVSGQIAQVLANQNECCCSTKMLIQETAAQNRYDSAINTQKILDALAQNKIDSLQQQVNALTLQSNLAGVVRYPSSTVYTAGVPPFAPGIAPFTPFA